MCSLFTIAMQVPELSAPELHQVLESIDRDDASPKPLIVDVRTAAEYEGGHIKHSVNASFLPPWSFSNRVEPLLHVPKTHPIIVVCLSAHRCGPRRLQSLSNTCWFVASFAWPLIRDHAWELSSFV